jgi:hypothetical protein
LPLYSQKDFRSGYIITNQGDTLQGLINVRSNYQNSRSCEFKEKDTDKPASYLPGEITGYRVENGKYYISKQARLKEAPELYFLEYLVDGIVDLYYINDLENDYYFIEKNGDLKRLSNEDVIYISENQVKYTRKSNQYTGVLTYVFQESPETVQKIKNTDYDYKSLIRITKEYHGNVCTDTCIDYTKSTQNCFFLEPGAGFNREWMGLKTSPDWASDLSPLIVIRLRYVPFKSKSNWNFLTGLGFTNSSFHGKYENTIVSGRINYFAINASYYLLSIPVGFEYLFSEGKIEPGLSFSFQNAFLIRPEWSVYQYPPDFPDNTVLLPCGFTSYHFGFLAGFGLKYYLKKTKYIYIRNDFEYRQPYFAKTNYIDYQRIYGWMVTMGYGFSL